MQDATQQQTVETEIVGTKNPSSRPHMIAFCYIKIEQQSVPGERGIRAADWVEILKAMVDWKHHTFVKNPCLVKLFGEKIKVFSQTLAPFLGPTRNEKSMDILGICSTPGEFDFMIATRIETLEPIDDFVLEVLCGPDLGPYVIDTQIMLALAHKVAAPLERAVNGLCKCCSVQEPQ